MYDPGIERVSDNCISLHRNENLFVDQLFLRNLIFHAIEDAPLNMYPDSSSSTLREAIGKYQNCSPENIYVGNGADGVLADLLSYFRDEHDEVGLQPLTYQVYPYLCKKYNYKQKSINETEQIWILDSPNSINGKIFNFSSIKNHPKILIWDNVYGEFTSKDSKPILEKENTIRVHSFSKFFALASLRVGYCIADTKVISKLLERKDIFNVNTLAQKTAVLALQNEEYFNSLKSQMLEAKEKLTHGLIDLGFSISPGEANFIWATHENINMKLLQEELAKAEILVRRFHGAHLENYLRITIPPIQVVNKLLIVSENILSNFS